MSTTIKSQGQEYKQASGNAGSAAHDVVDRIAGAASPAVDRLASSAHQAVNKIVGAAGTAAEQFSSKAGQVKAAQARLVTGTSDYVREHPLASLGIVVAAGWLLSRLFSSRSS